MSAMPTRPLPVRLGVWAFLVTVFAVLAYTQRGDHSNTGVYSYRAFANTLIAYLVWLCVVALIAINRFDLLALRPPERWGRALALAAAAFGIVIACEIVVSLLPLPQSPGKEQNLTPTHWEGAHAGAFVANLLVLALLAPFVEELMFRGLGMSLLAFLGSVPSMLIVGVTFGVDHGLLEGLLVLIPFGVTLAWLRTRTDSTIPGMLVHAVFNAGALVLAVST